MPAPYRIGTMLMRALCRYGTTEGTQPTTRTNGEVFAYLKILAGRVVAHHQ